MQGKNLVKNTPNLDKYVSVRTSTYAAALDAAVQRVRALSERYGDDLGHRCILFVPDKYTLSAEKRLYEGRAGSFADEVLTVNRLTYRVAEYERTATHKPLSRLGAILTVRRILRENAKDLCCFHRSAAKAGFGETMYDNICQLAASGLHSADLPAAEGVLGYKLRDLKSVYAAYEDATRGKYVDATGRLLLLDETLRAGTDYFANTSVVFACYDDFTPLGAQIVQSICALADHAEIVRTDCVLDVRDKEVEAYASTGVADELKAAATRIRNLANRGVRYGDMGVVVPSADYTRLKRIFTEYGIPYFADEKYALSSHPLARYLLDVFKTAASGTNENYLALAKNPYTGLSPEDADTLEYYVRYCALSEGSMAYPFTLEPNAPALEGALPAAEAARATLVRLVSKIRRRDITGGAAFCRAIEEAIPPFEAEISAAYNGNFPRAKEEILTAAAVLGETMGEGVGFAALLDALKECFALKEVAVIPNRADTVEVGDVSAFRVSAKPWLFVLGCNEGELPAVKRDEGLLSDRDLLSMAGKNAIVEPSIDTLNRRAEEELYSVLSASEHLFVAYRAETPSPVFARIEREARRVTAANCPDERESLSEGGRRADRLLALCPCEAAAKELYLVGKADRDAGGAGYGFEAELAAALVSLPKKVDAPSIVPNAATLYRRRLSVSRVQEYFACPFRCFLRYGLRLFPRPEGDVSVLDLGTFLHKVIEIFVAKHVHDDPARAVPAIIAQVLHDDPQILKGAAPGFVAELTEEATGVAAVVAAQLDKGGFEAKYTELAFGASAPFHCKEIPLSGGSIVPEGVIDRLDVCGNAARVIDYKTGYANFSAADIFYGRKIQLPIYLKVAQQNGLTPAGMFYFPFSSGFAAERNTYRLMGLFDERYAYEMDRGLCEPGYASDVVAARAASSTSRENVTLRRGGGAAVSQSTLCAVCDYAERVLGQGAEEMLSGYCAPSPLAHGGMSECTYCDMRAACTALCTPRRERKRVAVKPEFLEKCIEACRRLPV